MISHLLPSFFGFCAGLITANGICALINVIDIGPRLLIFFRQKNLVHHAEGSIIGGIFFGNLANIFLNEFQSIFFSCPFLISPLMHFLIFTIILSSFALFSGIFIGCLVMALAETVNIFPILRQRIGPVLFLPILSLFYALGKIAGSLWYFFSISS